VGNLKIKGIGGLGPAVEGKSTTKGGNRTISGMGNKKRGEGGEIFLTEYLLCQLHCVTGAKVGEKENDN